MNKKNLLVLFGGCSPEHDVSKVSALTIIANISEEKYNVIPVYITKEGKWLLYDGSIDNLRNVPWEKFGTPAALSPDRVNKGLLRIVGNKIKYIPVDAAFPALHGRNGEDGTIQGLLELCGIPYVGCGVLASALAMDKAFTKIIAARIGLNQLDYLTLNRWDLESEEEILKKIRYKIGYPCFVKPANAGSSLGISKAANKKELSEAIQLALEFDDKLVIEKAVSGRELECAVLGPRGGAQASVVGEILPAASSFYDYDAKYNNSESKTLVPADISPETAAEIQRRAVQMFQAVDGKGLARVDFFLENETGRVIFNEMNTMPGFTPISMYPMLWRASGIPTPDLVDRLIEIALSNDDESALPESFCQE
ncbi:MAG: D-alanine--D-alanine ligase [Clostridiales bacterium]|jgi:D-alanine-D-alanine ligase|nr:D-alanine--D-alanine ligase [Clostridiales bacterium]